MIKRGMMLLMALVLLWAAFPAFAEEEAEADLFDLFSDNGETVEWLGTAVPLTDGLLVTSADHLPEDIGCLAITDGASVWKATSVLKDRSGRMAFIFFDAGEQKPARAAWVLQNQTNFLRAEDLTARTGDVGAGRRDRAVTDLREGVWQGLPCLLVTLSDPVETGTPLLTGDGKLAGVIVAARAEGMNRYIAVTAGGIYAGLLEVADDPTADLLRKNAPEGFKVTAEGNLVTFDWSEMTLEEQEGKKAYLVVSDVRNSYLNYFPVAEIGGKQVQMLLCPGRTYLSGFVWTSGIPDTVPEDAALTVLPEAEVLTLYDFKCVTCAFAEAPAEGLKEGEAPAVTQEITEEKLRSGRMYYYSSSTYTVTEKTENDTLLIALTTPTGENYLYVSGWYYDPSLNADDTWYQPLEDMELLKELNRKGYPSGEYHVAMYVDGKLAGEFTFTLP